MTITHEQAMRLDHPSTLPARLDLAELLLSGGRINSVPQLDLRTVLNRQKTIHGADSRETLQLMDRYAELLDKMGMHSKALGQHLESVGGRTTTLFNTYYFSLLNFLLFIRKRSHSGSYAFQHYSQQVCFGGYIHRAWPHQRCRCLESP